MPFLWKTFLNLVRQVTKSFYEEKRYRFILLNFTVKATQVNMSRTAFFYFVNGDRVLSITKMRKRKCWYVWLLFELHKSRKQTVV